MGPIANARANARDYYKLAAMRRCLATIVEAMSGDARQFHHMCGTVQTGDGFNCWNGNVIWNMLNVLNRIPRLTAYDQESPHRPRSYSAILKAHTAWFAVKGIKVSGW
jgi:hypothetical protein